jgi:hypothetical protein
MNHLAIFLCIDMAEERWYHKPLPVAIISSLVSIAITSAGGILYAYMSHGQLVRQLGATTPDTVGVDIKALSSDTEKFKEIADLIHQYSNKVDDNSIRNQVVELIRNMPSNSDFVREIIRGVNSKEFFNPTISIIDVSLSEYPDKVNFQDDRDKDAARILRYICDGKIECKIYPNQEDVFRGSLMYVMQQGFYDLRDISRVRSNYNNIFSDDPVVYMQVYYRCGSGKDVRKEQFPLNTYIIFNCE